MSDDKGGWPEIKDMDAYLAETNKASFLSDFPEEGRWKRVQGVQFRQADEYHPEPLVAIQAHDQRGEFSTFWMSVPNAMHLLHLLQGVQQHLGEKPRADRPEETKPHSI